MPGLCLSLQLIGKDIEEAIEEETSGDLKKAYLTIGKVKLGEHRARVGSLERFREMAEAEGCLWTWVILEAPHLSSTGHGRRWMAAFVPRGAPKVGVSKVKQGGRSLHSVSDCTPTSHWTQAAPQGHLQHWAASSLTWKVTSEKGPSCQQSASIPDTECLIPKRASK